MHLTIFFLLLIAHILGDFYLQTRQMAAEKQEHISAVLRHSAVYLGLTLLLTAGYLTGPTVLWLLGLSIFHAAVDWIFRKKDFPLLLLDQALHIAAIVLVAHICEEASGNALQHWVLHSGGFLADAWIWAMRPRRLAIFFFFLLNLKPANILIVKLLDQCGLNPQESGTRSGMSRRHRIHPAPPRERSQTPALNPGAVIGCLERIMTLVLILCGEYLAGTLVVALKSIGRIKKLEDKEFSDKFIIGSLFSLMIPVLSAIAIHTLP